MIVINLRMVQRIDSKSNVFGRVEIKKLNPRIPMLLEFIFRGVFGTSIIGLV